MDVNKVQLISVEKLGPPHIDVVMSSSDVFCDLFINQMNFYERTSRYMPK